VLLVGAVAADEHPIGMVTANGARLLDPEAIALHAVPFAEVDAASERVRSGLAVEEEALRGGRRQRTRYGRAVVLVDLAVTNPARLLAASRALAGYQTDRVVAAALHVTQAAAEELGHVFDEVTSLDGVRHHRDEWQRTPIDA
jgi:predicted phosphoribosyltransferase